MRTSLWFLLALSLSFATSINNSSKLIIRGIHPNLWEFDYLQDIFRSQYFDYLPALKGSPVADIYICQTSSDAEAIRSSFGEEDLIPVLLHLSDETLLQVGCLHLYPRSSLVFREYGHQIFRGKNVYQFPLGYMNGYLSSTGHQGDSISVMQSLNIKATKDRQMKWSFIGNIHGKGVQMREEMIATLSEYSTKQQQKFYCHNATQLPASELYEYYSNSVFVPSARGWSNLDCLRIYEALIAGAVPIIVGPHEELMEVFSYDGDRLPAIYCASWSDAVETMQMLLSDEDYIDHKRLQLQLWWMKRFRRIHQLVANVLLELYDESDINGKVKIDLLKRFRDDNSRVNNQQFSSYSNSNNDGSEDNGIIISGLSIEHPQWDYLTEIFPRPYFKFEPDITNSSPVSNKTRGFVCSSLDDVHAINRLKLDSIELLLHLSNGLDSASPCHSLYIKSKVILASFGNKRIVNYIANLYQQKSNDMDRKLIMQIPLGYMNSFLSLDDRYNSLYSLQEHRVLVSSMRQYKWAFIGELYTERRAIIKSFMQIKPYYISSYMVTAETKRIYENSLFVLCPPSWSQQDTTRIYEAMLAGALPIIVGKVEDFSSAFSFFDFLANGRNIHNNINRMPAVYAPDWGYAQTIINTMSGQQIDIKRKELRLWWQKIMRNIHINVDKIINSPTSNMWNERYLQQSQQEILMFELQKANISNTSTFSVSPFMNDYDYKENEELYLRPPTFKSKEQSQAAATKSFPSYIVRGLNSVKWEWEFLHELFDSPYFAFTPSYNGTADVVVCSDAVDYNQIKSVSYHEVISVLIHLSDEHYSQNGCIFLYPQSRVVLRAYWFNAFWGPHVHHLPLGYMNTFLLAQGNNSLHAITNQSSSIEVTRKYRWSFVGFLHGLGKEERQQMVATFSAWKPYFIGSSVPVKDVKAIYEQSDFVLSGRGWYSLDCLRVYEAAIAGAIPVIVGSHVELQSVFGYEGHRVPAVYARTWEIAFHKVFHMSHADIVNTRRQLHRWWLDTLRRLREHVANVFNGDIRAKLWLDSHANSTDFLLHNRT